MLLSGGTNLKHGWRVCMLPHYAIFGCSAKGSSGCTWCQDSSPLPGLCRRKTTNSSSRGILDCQFQHSEGAGVVAINTSDRTTSAYIVALCHLDLHQLWICGVLQYPRSWVGGNTWHTTSRKPHLLRCQPKYKPPPLLNSWLTEAGRSNPFMVSVGQ